MPTDAEYLQNAGLESAETPTTTPTTEGTESPTDQKTAQEMFDLYVNGQNQKFPVNSEFQFTHNGKIQKVPYSSLVNSWRQASHYNSKYNELKPQIDEFQKLKPEFEKYKGFYDKYGQFQEWSEQNPEEWQRIWELYEQRQKYLSGQEEYNPITQEVNSLKQQLQDIAAFKQSWEQQQEEAQTAQDVEYVKTEIQTFASDYPELDLEQTDEDGLKLWAKVVQFGLQHNLPDFESAALKYFKPEIADIHAARARNEAMKGLKTAKQSGEVARSSTPFNLGQEGKKVDFRKASYGELLEMARNSMEAQG